MNELELNSKNWINIKNNAEGKRQVTGDYVLYKSISTTLVTQQNYTVNYLGIQIYVGTPCFKTNRRVNYQGAAARTLQWGRRR